MNKDSLHAKWDLNRFYYPKFSSIGRESLVLLNYRTDNKISDYWKVSGTRVCVDGACNLLINYKELVPDVILGDFDSVEPESLQYYTNLNVKTIKNPDQDTTDFTKALNYIFDEEKQTNQIYDTIIALNGTGGCLSHIFANIHALFNCENRKIILCGKENIAFIVWPGKTVINLLTEADKVIYCSIVPLGVAKSITTTGLRWNLENSQIGFMKGAIISTSNEFASDSVTIDTSDPCLFIVDIIH